MEVGLFIIRAVVGLGLAAHGAQKLFGAFGGGGLAGTGAWLESEGFGPGRRAAYMAGGSELVGGLLLAAGLFTPLAAAIVVGVMLVAGATHAEKGFFITRGGYEYTLILGAVAAGIAFTGPGLLSLDAAFGIDVQGLVPGFIALAVGLGAGAVQLAVRDRTPAQVRG
jgi:putative oxidoreductase